jgi:hypothetical protein
VRAGGHRGSAVGRALPFAVLLCWTAPATAEEPDTGPDAWLVEQRETADYAPLPAWNGLGRFVDTARGLGLGVEFAPASRLPVDPSLNLVVVFPDAAPDDAALRDFVAAGGRILLADDFGLGAGAQAAFGFGRLSPPASPAVAFRGDPHLPAATPVVRHPSTEGIGAVLANHPAVVDPGPFGRCLLAFLAPGRPCLLAEAGRGYGVVLVLSDPSVLIDHMLDVSGNRRLAEGLLRYLTANRRPVVTLVLPAAAYRAAAAHGSPQAGFLAAVRRWSRRLSDPLADAPPWFWGLLGATVVLLLAAAWMRFPSRDDLRPPRLLIADRGARPTAHPTPALPEAWNAFAQAALGEMHDVARRRAAAAAERLLVARRAGAGLRRVLRLRLARARLAALVRRIGALRDDPRGAPSLEALDRLAEDFVRLTASGDS